MKPVKGTKGRKPKPHSKGGRRSKVAAAARRAASPDRARQSRAESKRQAARKAEEESRTAGRGSTQRAGSPRRPAPMRPIEDLEAESAGHAAGKTRLELPADLALERAAAARPLIAIVGRPNVGKSTLFNRLTRSRRSIVGDEPGITRDRIYGVTEWLGRQARVVDTGGVLPDDPQLIPAEILRQAQVALAEAAFVVMVVDGRSPLSAPDYALARLLFKSGKPVLLAVNKMESGEVDPEFLRLGLHDLLPISAEHGIGIDELLEHVFSRIKAREELAQHAEEQAEPAGDFDQNESLQPNETSEEDGRGRLRTHGQYQQREISIAIVGRPNVGKSTLLNVLTGSARAIVSPVAGTTRDAVDEVVEYDGARLRFIDTAGIRRKGKTKAMAEKLSVVMARRHLEAADVALLVIDASEGVTAADATIGGYAHESGRSVIVVVNKWDLVTTGRTDGKPPADKAIFERQLRNALKYLAYAPVVFISAAEEKNIHSVLKLVREVAAERRKRVSTGQMNRFLERVDFERATVPMANKMRIFYMTQAAVAPPTFILFTNRKVKLHFSFERFLENQIRAAFGFRGSPIRFKVRSRNEREAR